MSPEKINYETLEANLVIIGGGGSGLTAAVTAAEKGVTGIVVIEKQGHLGGNSAMAMGLFACDSPVQKAEMIDCRADECFKIAMNWAHWKVNPRIVRAFFDKSGDTIRWLEGKGFKFRLKKMYPNQIPVWHIPEGFGAGMIKVFTKNCENMGVKIIRNTSAGKILRGEKGEVTGVLAKDDQGKELKIKSRSVVIASGGFSGNQELLKKYCLDYHDGMILQGNTFLKGDGLALAADAGAAIADTIPLLKIGGHVPDSKAREAFILRFIAQDPHTVWLNNQGKRFIDETVTFSWDCINAILRQPDKVTFSLFDDRIRQDIEETGTVVTSPHPHEEKGMPGLKADLREKAKLDNGHVMIIADNWDEIAGWMGVDARILNATIAEYNSACDCGHDQVFAKDQKYLRPLLTPPYYAVRCCTAYHETLGGIKTNENMEVVDTRGSIIPGLYVAGVIADDWVPESYWSVLCSTAFGFAINSGRIAGASTVDYISKYNGDNK